jgi:hypothetical protein
VCSSDLDAEVPVGNPLILKLTAPEKPYCGAIEIVTEA